MKKKYKGPFRSKRKSNKKEIEKVDQLKEEEATDMRLNKYLAHSGIASRRKADELIKAGRVTVNGEIILEMGYRVQPEDVVTFDGKKIEPVKKFIYLLMNKPYNVISTVSDEKGRRTVIDITKEYTKERIYPVGRLDRNTTGLLILTNDGDFAQRLAHPKHEVTKVYRVTLDQPVSDEHLEAIRNTLELEDGPAPVDKVSRVEGAGPNVVGIEIHIGRNRIVRRIFEHLGYQVKRLDRRRYGMLTKKGLTVGKCRYLTEGEINILKYL
jgi:23S rRNA pseudouridine2605 synthase